MPKLLRKALFLDRDGIINEDTGYPYKPEHIRFYDAVFPLCKKAAGKGYLLVVITNQAGVAKGKYTEDDVKSLHQWMAGEFLKRGISIERFYYCPHHPEATVPAYRVACACRKPKPGMIERAAKELNIDITKSLAIGDKPSDRIECTGLRSIIIKSRYTGDDFNVEDLAGVADYLL
ncbi:MAG: HAD family hydrolase [Chitinispirillaceae bacterium]|nr:HAD family hydrolase [Chitinispirillaceae bacterium]